MPVFLRDEDRKQFLAGVGELVKSGDLAVYAYCLMPNYYRLLCETPRGGLSRWMRYTNGDCARWFNRRHRRVGHLRQGPYKAIAVEDGDSVAECSRYIHLNPNRARITRPAERYRWSSYRNYVGGPALVGWVDADRVLRLLGGDRARYRAYVEAGKGERPVDPFERAVAGLVLGGDRFVERIRRLLADRPESGEVPSLRQLRKTARASGEDVEAAIESELPGVSARRRGRLLLYALRRCSSLRPTDIARRYSRTPAAVTIATKAVEAEAARDRRLAKSLHQLAQRFGVKH